MTAFETQVAAAAEWFGQPRFDGIVRLHTAREVAAQQGSIPVDYTVARTAAEAFHARLRALYAEGGQITTFGPYSPGQAVVMKRLGIEGIYLGGWATSAKGSVTEDPGPDLAELPTQPGPGRSGRPCPRAPHRRQEPALCPKSDGRRAPTSHAGGRLPPIHHRGRRHRTWRRRARSEPDPTLRRGRYPGLPHRGPEAGCQEVRPPGWQGPGRPGRAEQAAQCRAPAARRHARPGHHRRADRCGERDLPGRPR